MAPDLLVSGPERPPALGPVGRRRLRLVVAVVVSLVATALALRAIEDRRQAAQLERRLAQVVDLAVVTVEQTASQIGGDVGALRFRLGLQTTLRNDGPRELTLAGAAVGPYRARGMPVVAAGETTTVSLERLVVCPEPPSVPQVEPVPDAVRVDVRTAEGVRQSLVPLDVRVTGQVAEQVRRACGVLPLADALVATPQSARRRGDDVVVRLEMGNASTQPLRVEQAVVQQGLRVVLRDGAGAALAPPLELPPTQVGQQPDTVPIDVVLSVVSCREFYRLTPTPPGQPPLDTLLVTLGSEGPERVGPVDVDLDAPQLRELALALC